MKLSKSKCLTLVSILILNVQSMSFSKNLENLPLKRKSQKIESCNYRIPLEDGYLISELRAIFSIFKYEKLKPGSSCQRLNSCPQKYSPCYLLTTKEDEYLFYKSKNDKYIDTVHRKSGKNIPEYLAHVFGDAFNGIFKIISSKAKNKRCILKIEEFFVNLSKKSINITVSHPSSDLYCLESKYYQESDSIALRKDHKLIKNIPSGEYDIFINGEKNISKITF